MNHPILNFLHSPPNWFSAIAAALIGAVLVIVVISFWAGHLNQGIGL